MQENQNITRNDALRALLQWHVDVGADESLDTAPADAFALSAAARPQAVPKPQRARAPAAAGAVMATDEAVREASKLASACDNLEALKEAIAGFEGCPLKAGARSTVIDDGTFGADLMIVGEAPGKDEDRLGKPFVGRAGQLLDRMLHAVGRSRAENVYISNVLFWRPPGNRTPTRTEREICLPFIERLIDLADPKIIAFAGGVPAQTLLRLDTGIMRLRGVWRDYQTPGGKTIPALPLLHPAFLLRQPAQKKTAWRDMLDLDAKLRNG